MKIKSSFVLITVILCLSFCNAATDSEIKALIVDSMSYVDDAVAARGDYNRAKELCGNETNRLARLLVEVAEERRANQRIVGGAIAKLGATGASEQLPFLYAQVTNYAVARDAVHSILRISGLTSNALDFACAVLTNSNVSMPDRQDLCLDLIASYDRPGVCPLTVTNAMSATYSFFSSDPFYSEWYDNRVQKLLPDYEFSKRRLSVLRSVQSLGLNQYNEHFVTNAITQLVAYPEANLPD